jgi:hypothetical protein
MGQARLYVFRPYFSDLLVRERPTLLINGEPKSLLGYDQYDSYALPPGEHIVSLQPSNSESTIWQSRHAVQVEAGKTYFLALWNANDSDARSELTFIPIGRSVMPMPISVGGLKSVAVRYEVLSYEQAVEALRQTHRALPVGTSRAEP